MGFEFFIARRYLRSKGTIQFISVVNIISIIGLTVGVSALLVVLSVFNGFSEVVSSILISFDPHLRIERQGGLSEDEYRSLQALFDSDERIRGYSPVVTGKAMIVSRASSKVVFVRGVDERKIGDASGLKDKIVLGSLTLLDSANVGSIVIGLTLADRLAALVEGEVLVVSPYAFDAALVPFSQLTPAKFEVTGIFESNNKDYDANYAYVSIASAQRLFNMEHRISGVEVRLTDIDLVEEVKTRLLLELPPGVQVSSWYDLHKDLYSVMRIERWVAYIILSLIIVVATFNVLGSLTMTVIEKQRDIGVLKSMGATSKSLIRIFMFEGMCVGIVGTILGVCLGVLILYLQIEFHLFPLDTRVYVIPAIPVEIRPFDFLVVSIAALALSALASYYPARRAAKVVPIEAIRWE